MVTISLRHPPHLQHQHQYKYGSTAIDPLYFTNHPSPPHLYTELPSCTSKTEDKSKYIHSDSINRVTASLTFGGGVIWAVLLMASSKIRSCAAYPPQTRNYQLHRLQGFVLLMLVASGNQPTKGNREKKLQITGFNILPSKINSTKYIIYFHHPNA